MSKVTKKVKILIRCIFKTVHYRAYKCIVILHVPMGRAHRESSMSKLDYDAKRVAIIYMELLISGLLDPCQMPHNIMFSSLKHTCGDRFWIYKYTGQRVDLLDLINATLSVDIPKAKNLFV